MGLVLIRAGLHCGAREILFFAPLYLVPLWIPLYLLWPLFFATLYFDNLYFALLNYYFSFRDLGKNCRTKMPLTALLEPNHLPLFS
jgi:hypothetical protein